MMKVGTPITGTPLADIRGIKDIVPLRFNAMDDVFEVCEPFKAQYHAIITDNDEIIMIDADCKNKELLVDII